MQKFLAVFFLNFAFVLPTRAADSSKIDLFKVTIKQLDSDLDVVLKTSDNHTLQLEKVIEGSVFYTLLKDHKAGQKAPKTEQLLSAILSLNDYLKTHPDDELRMTETISACFRLLLKNGWQPQDALDFAENLDFLHSSSYPGVEITPVRNILDQLLNALFFSKDTQEFMDKITIKNQFKPIKEIVFRNNLNLTKKEVRLEIAERADRFSAYDVRFSYKAMKKDADKWPIWSLIPGDLEPAMKGMREFRNITNSRKYIIMRNLKKLYLHALDQARLSPKNRVLRVYDEEVLISQKPWTLSLAVAEDDQKIDIKVIVLSKGHLSKDPPKKSNDTDALERELYFFVQEFRKQGKNLISMPGQKRDVFDPRNKPDAHVALLDRPLYKLEEFSNGFIRVQKVSLEVQNVILDAIKEIEEKQQKAVLGTVHIAPWFKDELNLLEVERQMGMVTVRALRQTIKTYVKHKLESQENNRKKTVEEVLMAAHVLPMSRLFSSWHRDDLIIPNFANETPSIVFSDLEIMNQIAEETWNKIQSHERPGKWVEKSIRACLYAGNPQKLAPVSSATTTEVEKPKSELSPKPARRAARREEEVLLTSSTSATEAEKFNLKLPPKPWSYVAQSLGESTPRNFSSSSETEKSKVMPSSKSESGVTEISEESSPLSFVPASPLKKQKSQSSFRSGKPLDKSHEQRPAISSTNSELEKQKPSSPKTTQHSQE